MSLLSNKQKTVHWIILKRMKSLCLVTLLFSISACEITPQKNTTIPTYGDYYLWLKTLDKDELLQEIEQQKKNQDVKSPDADIYILLLHSLPQSPIYNPYTAKTILNELQLQYVESRYNPTNLALITLLRDLLNEQLLTRQKQNDIKVQFNNAKNMLSALQKKSGIKDKKLIENSKEITELQQKVQLLEEQISQLHRIEKSINEHGK
ncbi:hypothetical protein [Colwellia sp. UCD-KL20]|uniref:hypothetical protein n=1 Tax=Colwellia sp. UCD-KL20 TaxID=1917165 RepID=UPI000970F016|nr:hypothetical protein [Colwellia sp. UCD-KL20]